METIKRYLAFDGTQFGDRFACARHELTSREGLLDQIAAKTAGTHKEQLRWCGGDPDREDYYSSACGCMGCANHAFYQLGLEYAHWKVWMDELRGEQPSDSIPNLHTDVDVVLSHVPRESRIDVFRAVRAITGLGIAETKNLVDTPGSVVKGCISFYEGKHFADILDKAGAVTKLVVSDSQRWKIIS